MELVRGLATFVRGTSVCAGAKRATGTPAANRAGDGESSRAEWKRSRSRSYNPDKAELKLSPPDDQDQQSVEWRFIAAL
jgi:hypothetical protein